MADAPNIISDDGDIDFKETNIKVAMSNDDSIIKNIAPFRAFTPFRRGNSSYWYVLNFIVTRNVQPCEDCSMGEAKQSNMSKQPVEWSKKNGERLLSISAHQVQKLAFKKCH